MMGWEWRVFFPVESSDVLEVWSLLQPHDRPRGSPERRSDVYIKCTPGAGLKVRGGRLIEVKLRSTREATQGIELWNKVNSSVSSSRIITSDTLSAVILAQRTLNKGGTLHMRLYSHPRLGSK